MMKINNFRSKLSHASAVVSDSRFLKIMMARFDYNVRKVHVIYNGVDLNTIKPATSNPRQKTVLFLSNQINRQKGVYHFVQLSKNLKPLFPDVRFLWVGQTDLQGKTFETQGYISNDRELAEMYQSSYLLLLPSLWPEAMSYSVIQAMAYGKPVVAYDIGANREAIIPGQTGLLAEWGNIEQLTSCVRNLLLDTDFTIQMGRNARKLAEKKFGLKKMTSNYLNLMEEVTAK
jgi:glycosyltransferase involved in cell wall biosynthesis